jgi:magnesium chelatase family protein
MGNFPIFLLRKSKVLSLHFTEAAIDKLGLSVRAFNRVLKIARTIADLVTAPNIQVDHISEAIQYRNLDRGSRFK